MKIQKLIVVMVIFCTLPIVASNAQDLAVFKIPDSARPFVFILRLPSQDRATERSTNATPLGVEGLYTILAKGFKTAPNPRGIVITLDGALICRAKRLKENESGSVIQIDGMPILYPAGTSVLVYGRSMRLADLNEKTFDPSTTPGKTYTGTKINEMRVGFSADPSSTYDSVPDGEKAQAKFSGGDGSSIKHAVVIDASGEETGIRAAYVWSHEHYPRSRLLNEGEDWDGDRVYLEMKIVMADGKPRTNLFEITSFYGR